jgi:hypothetical protein
VADSQAVSRFRFSKFFRSSIFTLTMLGVLLGASASFAAAPVRIGVGSQGPISPQAMAQIEQVVGEVPRLKVVPIVPPGDVAACVRRFVAGEPDDRLDGMIVVSLPPDSFHVQRDAQEASFSGSYEIHTLDLSTLAEERHQFTFSDSEPVTGGMTAILAIPANLLAQRTTGTQLISGNAWEAFQAVQARIEAKLVAATRLYMATAPIRDTQPLAPLQCAQHLLEAGDAETALAVFRSAGTENPGLEAQVNAMIADSRKKMELVRAQATLGRVLGAIAGGDAPAASTLLAAYEKEPVADGTSAQGLRNAIGALAASAPDSPGAAILRHDIPGLDRGAFVATVKQMFSAQTGTEPAEVEISGSNLDIADQSAPEGIKTQLDSYAAALAKSAWLMSLRCGCDASAFLKGDPAGVLLLQAHINPSSRRPQVGIP